MKVRKLNYAQFKLEKQNLLSLVREWQKTDNEFFDQNYSKLYNSDLHYYWCESVQDMINFLEKDISEAKDLNFEKNECVFFIAEDDDIQGIALGYEPSTYRGYTNEFFGISGTFFEIKDMMISPTSMISRCYSIEEEEEEDVPHKKIGKELLKAVVDHVNTLDRSYPISARPNYNNQTAKDFFEKNLFELGCDSMGHRYTLKVANFVHIDKNIHKEVVTNMNTLVIEDYQPLSFTR